MFKSQEFGFVLKKLFSRTCSHSVLVFEAEKRLENTNAKARELENKLHKKPLQEKLQTQQECFYHHLFLR